MLVANLLNICSISLPAMNLRNKEIGWECLPWPIQTDNFSDFHWTEDNFTQDQWHKDCELVKCRLRWARPREENRSGDNRLHLIVYICHISMLSFTWLLFELLSYPLHDYLDNFIACRTYLTQKLQENSKHASQSFL